MLFVLKSKRKEEKGEKSCFLICVFGLLEWLLFFFSFLPITLPFFLFIVFSLCPSHSFLVNNITDWTGGTWTQRESTH